MHVERLFSWTQFFWDGFSTIAELGGPSNAVSIRDRVLSISTFPRPAVTLYEEKGTALDGQTAEHTVRIGERLYLYLWTDQNDLGCNATVIDGKVPLIVDPGYIRHAERLFSAMKQDGADPEAIKAVMLTHGHPDHAEAASLFKRKAVKIGGAKQDERLLETSAEPAYIHGRMIIPDVRLDFYLREGDLTVGKHEFQIFHTPGHTPGSVSLYWPSEKTLISGDLVFQGSVGRFDTPGGDGQELARSVERMSRLEVELLIPGHGPAVAGRKEVAECFRYVKTYVLPAFTGRSKN